MARDRDPEVRILTSPAEVAAARAEGDAYRQELTSSFPPDYLDSLHRRVTYSELHRVAEERGRIVPLLRDMATGEGAQAAAACIVLARLLNEPAHLDRLQEILATATPEALDQCLDLLGKSGDVLCEVSGVEALAPWLREMAAGRVDQGRVAALRAAFELGVTIDGDGVVEELTQLANQSRSPLYLDGWIGHAFRLLARRGGDGALAAAQALLRPPLLDSRSAQAAGRSRDPRIVNDLERVLSSDTKKSDIGGALQGLAYVQGPAAIPRLLEALPDKELVSYAATGLGIAAEGTGDEGVVVALSQSAAGESNPGPHAMAMARIGGPLAMRTLAGLVTRVPVNSAMYVGWRVKGITVATAIQRFVEAGVIPRMPTDAALRTAAESVHVNEPDDVGLLWYFLRVSGRLIEVSHEDVNTRDVARHPVQLEHFASGTGGRVVVEHASQRSGPANARDEHEVIVQFVWGDRVYQVIATGINRNFDTLALRVLLNEALRDRGDTARFVQIQGKDYQHFVFGDERAVTAACDDLFIPHGPARTWLFPWRDTLAATMFEAGESVVTPQPDRIDFHIVSPTDATRALPRQAVDEAIARTLGTTLAIDVQAGVGWTVWDVRIPRELVAAHGVDAVETLFESLCEIVEAHLGRTCSAGGWARIKDGELAGAIDALDWLQYFGPRFGNWLKGRSRLLSARATPRGAQIVKLACDPLAPSWTERKDSARNIHLRLRPFPEAGQIAVDPKVRLQATGPPEPVQWKPEQRAEMLKRRGETWKAIEKGMAQGRLFDRFRRRYLAAELDAPLLDRIATWLPHYGVEATTAAFRVVAQLHGDHPAAGALDDAALEGCVKLVSWGGDERPLAERELLAAHLIDLKDPAVARFAREMYEPLAVAGMVKMTAMQVAACDCERCRETKKRLG